MATCGEEVLALGGSVADLANDLGKSFIHVVRESFPDRAPRGLLAGPIGFDIDQDNIDDDDDDGGGDDAIVRRAPDQAPRALRRRARHGGQQEAPPRADRLTALRAPRAHSTTFNYF